MNQQLQQQLGVLLANPRMVLTGKLTKGTVNNLHPIKVTNTTNHAETIYISSNQTNQTGTSPFLSYSQNILHLQAKHSVFVNNSLVVPQNATYPKNFKVTGSFFAKNSATSVGVQQTVTLNSQLVAKPMPKLVNMGLKIGIVLIIAVFLTFFIGWVDENRKKRKKVVMERKQALKQRFYGVI